MTTSDGADAPKPSVSRGAWRTVGSILGLILLIAAVVFALRRGGDPAELLRTARRAPSWLVALALALPALNWALVTLSFWIPMRRYGRVGAGEMLAIIGAAWLLNYLPLRPGLFGRIAYHKAINKIAVRDSVRVTLIGMSCGAASVVITLAIASFVPPTARSWTWAAWLSLPPCVAITASLMLHSRGWSWLPAVFLFRYTDLLVWIVRYLVVFRIAAIPIDLPQATALAAVSQATIVVPFIGNGLGIREWTIGLVAANWPFAAGPSISMPAAITADLFNRAAEILIAIPIGLGGALWIARRKKA